MKEAKEKRQEQIAKRRRLSSLRASTSKSDQARSKLGTVFLKTLNKTFMGGKEKKKK